MTSFFSTEDGAIWIQISQTGAEWHVDCGDMVGIETSSRIPIWRTFWRIQWHVIPEPPATLQGAATWWIHRQDPRTICYIAGCGHLAKSMPWSCHIAGCKNFIRHIENRFLHILFFLVFLMQFELWRAAAFVPSPIRLLHEWPHHTCVLLRIYVYTWCNVSWLLPAAPRSGRGR